MTAAPIGFAILGTGIIAETHRQAIATDLGARLVAVGHYDLSRFAEIGRRFGVPCLSEAELLKRPDVDVVCLATPSGQHAEQAIARRKRASTCSSRSPWRSVSPTLTQ